MGYEIDFLPVGEGEKSGDAIALRYGNLFGPRSEQTVVVVDGGTKLAGEGLARHIRQYYGTDLVDFVFLTHPDGDHASGLTVVLEQLRVGKLIMHQPWNHAEEVRSLFKDGRLTDESLEIRIRKSLEAAHNLETLALSKKIQIIEPFTGLYTEDCVLRVLGPDRGFYRGLLPGFRRTPDAKAQFDALLRKALDSTKEAVRWVAESLNIETLDDSGETSAENNSSAIILMDCDGQKVLLCGDAGIPALTKAVDYAKDSGIDLSRLTAFQVPHHGSRRNLGPSILNRIKAPTACISASKDGEPKHPSKKVTNALIRRGCNVFATQGMALTYFHEAPIRSGWSAAQALQFNSRVEE